MIREIEHISSSKFKAMPSIIVDYIKMCIRDYNDDLLNDHTEIEIKRKKLKLKISHFIFIEWDIGGIIYYDIFQSKDDEKVGLIYKSNNNGELEKICENDEATLSSKKENKLWCKTFAQKRIDILH